MTVRVERAGWSMVLLVAHLGFLALWTAVAAANRAPLVTAAVGVGVLVLGWTCRLLFLRRPHARSQDRPATLGQASAATIATATWLAASVIAMVQALPGNTGTGSLVTAALGGAAAVWLSTLRPAARPVRPGGLRLLQVTVGLFLGVGSTIFLLIWTELTPEYEGANIGGAIAVTLIGAPLATAGLITLVLGLVAEVARPRTWSWLFLAAGAAGALQIGSDTAVQLIAGCVPPSRRDAGPPADFSFAPLGVNCRYELGADAGHLIVEPSFFPTLFVAACVVAYVALRRLETRTRQDPAPVTRDSLDDLAR